MPVVLSRSWLTCMNCNANVQSNVQVPPTTTLPFIDLDMRVSASARDQPQAGDVDGSIVCSRKVGIRSDSPQSSNISPHFAHWATAATEGCPWAKPACPPAANHYSVLLLRLVARHEVVWAGCPGEIAFLDHAAHACSTRDSFKRQARSHVRPLLNFASATTCLTYLPSETELAPLARV